MSKQKRKSKKSADGSVTETPSPVETVSGAPASVAPPAVDTKPEAPLEAKRADETTTAAPPVVETSAEPPAVSTSSPSVAPKAKKPRKTVPKKKVDRPSEPPTVREGKPTPSSASALKVAPAVLDKKLDALEQKLEEKMDAHQAARKGMASDPDESSIPPVVEHEHEEQFFADAEKKPAVSSGLSGGFDAVDPKHAQKMTAAAHARRAHLTKYVKAAVAAAAVICMAAFIRMKLTSSGDHDTSPHAATNVAQVMPQVKTPDPVKQPDPAIAPAPVVDNNTPATTDNAVQDTTAGDAKAVELDDMKDAAPSSSPVGVVGDGTAKPKTAWQEKATAKAALESGNNGTAIAAGERSIALDPTDGETWLVLGAAYQASGNNVQAKRCFNACLTQGKKGPLDECKSMLQQ